jgi:hypothetical protein
MQNLSTNGIAEHESCSSSNTAAADYLFTQMQDSSCNITQNNFCDK